MILRALLVVAALLAGCHAPERGAGVPDPAKLPLDTPGVACAEGLQVDAERGCAGDRGAREASLVVTHYDEMSDAYRLVEASYAVDGELLYRYRADRSSDDPGPLELPVLDGGISPGEHELGVRLVYRGHGAGAFSYLNGYAFEVQSTCLLRVKPYRLHQVRVVGFEQDRPGANLEDRPAVRCEMGSGPR